MRHGQERLRVLTLRSYADQCAVCDVSATELLVASHIHRWADDADARGRLDNIICLCRFHDALFECGYWSLSDNLDVVLRPGIQSATVGSLLPASMSFRRPSSSHPDPTFLSKHRIRCGFEPGAVAAEHVNRSL